MRVSLASIILCGPSHLYRRHYRHLHPIPADVVVAQLQPDYKTLELLESLALPPRLRIHHLVRAGVEGLCLQ